MRKYPALTPQDTIDPAESATKLALDHAEFVARVPELQRSATAVNFNESGGLVLVPPNHPAVRAFIKELAGIERETADLRTARRRLRVASESYQVRVSMRSIDGDQPSAFERSVSLSAILIARAEARHWHRVVERLERDRRAKQRTERNAEMANRVCFINGEAYPITRTRER